MLIPKRTKYRKPHRVSYEGKAKGNTVLTQGEYDLWLKKEHTLQLDKSKQLELL